MKVLLIDPWGTDNTAEYLNGLIHGISVYVDLTVYTNHGFKLENSAQCDVIRGFFKKSDYMKKGKNRTIVRGIEYVKSYIEIVKILKKTKYDIVHINWLLFYRVDIFFLNLIKKKCSKIIYTAHNVLPHNNSERYINQLEKIYKIVDGIIVHGNNVKDEFKKHFPNYVNKIYIQHHGANIKSKISYDEYKIDEVLRNRVSNSKRIYICFGKIFYNKGIDRILKIWLMKQPDSMLIVAGGISESYGELKEIIQKAKKEKNIIVLDQFVEDNTLNYLITKSNIIVLPYRHASMSGVVFTAADFAKTVLYTDVGALSEYLLDGENSFRCANKDKALETSVEYIEKHISNIELEAMGHALQEKIRETCSWDNIGKKIFSEIYEENKK